MPPDQLLFPFLDIAVRVVAVLVLCAIPLLITLPSLDRVLRSVRQQRTPAPRPFISD